MLAVVRVLSVGAALSVLVWLPLGCGGTGELREASFQGGSYARISVAYVHRHDDPPTRVHLAAEAQFVRFRNVGAEGIAALLSQGPGGLGRGECRLVDRRARSGAAFAADGPEAEVALLDAGDLLLRGPSGQSALAARRYPDVVPFVAGVYYGESEPPLDLPHGATGEVQVIGVGGTEIGPFAITVPLPLEVPLCDVSWSPAGIELRWTGAHEPDGLRVEVQEARGDASRTLHCVAPDDGSFTVPAALVAKLHAPTLAVTAARQRRQPFVASGVGGGEIVVSLLDTTELTAPLPEAPAR